MRARDRSAVWLGLGAIAVLAAASSSPPTKPPPRGRAKGEGRDGDLISYFVDPSGTIITRTQADDVQWGTPTLQAKVHGDFRAMVERWKELVDEAGLDFRVPTAQIFGVMWAESKGDPRAKSPAGALGLMQVMPFHFPDGTPEERMLEPRANLRKGVQLLASSRSGARDLVQMASFYNAGGPKGGPYTNESWLAAGRNPALTSRWGYPSESGYIDRVVAANNTFLALKGLA